MFAAYQRTSTPFTGACRVPGSIVAGSPEFKRVVKCRISPVFVARRISDVKAEYRSTRHGHDLQQGILHTLPLPLRDIKYGLSVEPDPSHPSGKAASVSRNRSQPAPGLLFPVRRTTPKCAKSPGWKRITWGGALSETAQKFAAVREEKNGAEAAAFPPLAYTYQADSSRRRRFGSLRADRRSCVSADPVSGERLQCRCVPIRLDVRLNA